MHRTKIIVGSRHADPKLAIRKSNALFITRVAPVVTETNISQLLEYLNVVCTRLKTKYDGYNYFHISISDTEFGLIIQPAGLLVTPFREKLKHEQKFCIDKSTGEDRNTDKI